MKVGYLLKNKGNINHTITPDALLIDAASLMSQHHIGSLVVSEGKGILSIVTERDVMRAVGDNGDKFTQMKVTDVMPKDLITCDINETVDAAMDLMINNDTKHRIRHLPVMAEGEFAGVISMSDIIEALLTETKLENNLLKSYIKDWPEE